MFWTVSVFERVFGYLLVSFLFSFSVSVVAQAAGDGSAGNTVAWSESRLDTNSNLFGQPSRNPHLADSYNNQGHWNDAATDSTLIAVPRGHFKLTPDSFDILPNETLGIPFYASEVQGADVRYFWTGFQLVKLHKTKGGYREIHRVGIKAELDNYRTVSADERLRQAQDIELLLARGDESALARYLTDQPNRLISAVEDQVSKGVLYSLFAKDDVFIAANARGLLRIEQEDPDDPDSFMKPPYQVRLPDTLFDDHRAALHTFFPTDTVFGLGMSFSGVLVINTVSGRLIALNPKTFEVLDSLLLDNDEVISNSFATSPELGGRAIYVASNKAMYRFLVNADGKFIDDPSQGAWRATYAAGRRLPYGKISDGTGATPTLMGFGQGEDELVVITDGSDQMRLVAFWRNEIPETAVPVQGEHTRVAGIYDVDFGWPIAQSEQSVVTAGPYAFVVSSVPQSQAEPLPARGAYLRGLLMGVTREPVMGLAMYRWEPESQAWKEQWVRSDVGSLATVPMLSIPTRQVIINGYFKNRLGEAYHLGFDLDSGDVVMSIATDLNPLFNGTFTGLKCDPDGNLWYSMMFGLVTLHTDRMTRVANPDPRALR